MHTYKANAHSNERSPSSADMRMEKKREYGKEARVWKMLDQPKIPRERIRELAYVGLTVAFFIQNVFK
jgi:hypothetical protein